jgi:hypothetical protein
MCHNHVGQLILWHLNNHRIREKWNKLLTQTHSPEVEYSLFIMVAMVVMSERLDKRTGATLAVFSPPIFTGTVSDSVASFSAASSQERLRRFLYICF